MKPLQKLFLLFFLSRAQLGMDFGIKRGGMKGKDLLGEIFGDDGGFRGIEELRIERGRLVIRLAE